MIEFLKRRVIYHSISWISLTCFLTYLVFLNVGGDFSSIIIEVILSLTPIALGIYSNFYIKSLFLDKRKYVYYVIGFIVVMVVCVLLYELYEFLDILDFNSLFQNLINLFFFTISGMGLQYLKRGIISQYQLQEIKAKTIENELNALKAQLNPHFLFNTLNNIYGMNQIDSSIGSEMILELSQLMRYHLDSSKSQFVSLESEWSLLESYIKLENLRLPDLHTTSVSFKGDPINKKIPPLILLPFLENAFKHGTHSTKESFINLRCEIEDEILEFEINNSVFENKKVIKTNIGLENTKRRLELLYGSNFTLNINKTKDIHSILLKLKLES